MFRTIRRNRVIEFIQRHCRNAVIKIVQFKIVKSVIALFLRLSRSAFKLKASRDFASMSILDDILDESPNLQHFLSDQNIQNRYYCALKNYFSSKNISRAFPRKSYNSILDQMKILMREVPEFAQSNWKTMPPDSKSFTLEIKEQDCGRTLDPLLWRIYRYEWIESLKKMSGNMSDVQTKKTLVQTLTKIQKFESDLKESKKTSYKNLGVAIPSRKTPKILRNSFYSELKRDGSLRRVAAQFLHQHLTRTQNQIFFELIDANLIIHYLNELRQNPKKVLPLALNTPIPNAFLSVIKDLIPDPNKILKDKHLFPVSLKSSRATRQRFKVRNSVYFTQPVRPFHALWCGIFGKDCLGGDLAHLEKLCAARWAIPLLEGTQTFFVERNGKYQGFIRTVPMNHPLFQKPLQNLEIWVPAMSQQVVQKDFTNQLPFVGESTSVLNLWFKSWMDVNVKRLHHQKLLVSDSKIIDNERVKELLFLSEFYKEGASLLQPRSLTPSDLLIHKINAVLPPPPAAKTFFTGAIVLDATLSDVTHIKILRTTDLDRPLLNEKTVHT